MDKLRSARPAIAAFLLMITMSLNTSSMSFFVSPVCADLGFPRGSFTFYYSLMAASGALAGPFLGQYMGRHGVRRILLISSIWCGGGLFLFSFARTLWMFYLIGICAGFFSRGCMALCANVVVAQSYSAKKASGILGIVMSGSGVGGMLFSLLVPRVIDRFGWQMGYRFIGTTWLVMVLVCYAILGDTELTGGEKKSRIGTEGLTRAQALRSPQLYLVIVTILIVTACSGVQQQIPSMLTDRGFDAARISVYMSLVSASLAGGKVLQGFLCGRLGVVTGSRLMMTTYALGFVMLQIDALIVPALICVAVGLGFSNTLMAINTRHVFGSLEYAAIWGVVSAASSAGSVITTPGWGVVYDLTGSYTPAMIAGTSLLVVGMVLMTFAYRWRAAQNWEN